METPVTLLACLAFGYLVGSLPFAVIVSKLFGLADPRSFGSGNPGATNVLRSGNKAAAVLTLLGDASKGWLAMALVTKLGAGGTALAGSAANMETAVALTGLAAFLGHVFPIFLRFKGGKGVATALGVMLGIHWILALAAAATWLLVALATRYSSLAALVAATEAPFVVWMLTGRPDLTATVAAMSLLLIWRHKANIQRLMAGTESRIGSKKKV